jgi:hypothetical protein
MNTATTDTGGDQLKDVLYRDYNQGRSWKQRLHRQAVHKALDIAPEDDVQITQKSSGLGWRELAIIIAGMVAGTVVTGQLISKPAAAIQPVSPVDSEYDVRFYDKDGQLIEVPHISRRARFPEKTQ